WQSRLRQQHDTRRELRYLRREPRQRNDSPHPSGRHVVAVRRVALTDGKPLGADRLNGIAVSANAQKIWVTVSGAVPDYPNSPGALLELPAFGPGHTAALDRVRGEAAGGDDHDLAVKGRKVFAAEFTPADGLGPLFNGRSCLECHQTPE